MTLRCKHPFFFLTWSLVSLAMLLPLAGCNSGPDDVATVEGTVTLDGKPLPDATVQFQPEGGRPSTGATDENGHYTLQYTATAEGAEIGRHTVRISTGGERSDPETGQITQHEELVPAKYNAQTELNREVTAGSNEINFELTSQ